MVETVALDGMVETCKDGATEAAPIANASLCSRSSRTISTADFLQLHYEMLKLQYDELALQKVKFQRQFGENRSISN